MLILSLGILAFAVGCSNDPETVLDDAEAFLEENAYRMDMTFEINTDNTKLSDKLKSISDVALSAVVDGKDYSYVTSLGSGSSKTTLTVTLSGSTCYMIQDIGDGNSVEAFCDLSDAQLSALMEKDELSYDADLGFDEFETATLEKDGRRRTVTLTDLKDDSMDKIKELVGTFIDTDSLTFGDVTAIYTVNDGKPEDYTLKIFFSLEANLGDGKETVEVELTSKSAFDYSVDGVKPPKKTEEFVEIYFDTVYGTTDFKTYLDAELGTYVVISTYVQAKDEWRDDGSASIYTQTGNGGRSHLVYEAEMTKWKYDSLAEGTPVVVCGYKDVVDGVPVIADAEIDILYEQSKVTEPDGLSPLLGTEFISDYFYNKAYFFDMTVKASGSSGASVLYGPDGTGKRGDDIYFKAAYNGAVCTFVLKAEFAGVDSALYKKVESLNVGDVIEIGAFLFMNGETMLPYVYYVTK